MNGFDIALLVLLAVLVVLGLMKGLARLLIGMAALLTAFVLAAQFHGQLATRLTWFDWSDNVERLIAYLIIFFGVMLAGGLVGWLARKLMKAAMLGWADRLAGGAVGLVVAVLVAALLVLPLVAYSPFGERALRESALAPYVTAVADVARALVPDELSDSYDKRVEDLREYWRERWRHEPEALEVRRRDPGRRV
jgi:membrane protein required for colicin V production